MENTKCIRRDDVVAIVNDDNDNDDKINDKNVNNNIINDDYQYKYNTSLLLTSLLQKQQQQQQKQEKHKSNDNVTIVATTTKQSTVRMIEYTKYRQRILTFTILKYFGKPIQLSPIICSMLGWSMNIIKNSNVDSTTTGSITDITTNVENIANTNTNTNSIITQYDNTVQCTSCRAMVALLYLGGDVSSSSTTTTTGMSSSICPTILSPNVTNRLIHSYEEQLYYKSHYEFCIHYQPSYNYYKSNINPPPTITTTGTTTTMSTSEHVEDNNDERKQDPTTSITVYDNNNDNIVQQLILSNSATNAVSIIKIPLLLAKILPEYVLELYDTPYSSFIRHCLDMITYIQKQQPQQLHDMVSTSLNETDVSLLSILKIPNEITAYHNSKIKTTESTSSITIPSTRALSPSLLDILITIVTKHQQLLKKETLDQPVLVKISVLLVFMGWYPTYMLRPQEEKVYAENVDNSNNNTSDPSIDISNNTTVECPFCCVQRSVGDLIFTKFNDVPASTTTPIMNKRRKIEVDSSTNSSNESKENTMENNDTIVDDTNNSNIDNSTTVPTPTDTAIVALNNNINVLTGHRYYCPYRCGFVVPSSNYKKRLTNPPLWQLVSDAIITTTTQSENSISNNTDVTESTNSNNDMEQDHIQQQQKLTTTNWLLDDGNINNQDEYMTQDIKSLKVHQLLRSALSNKTFPSIV